MLSSTLEGGGGIVFRRLNDIFKKTHDTTAVLPFSNGPKYKSANQFNTTNNVILKLFKKVKNSLLSKYYANIISSKLIKKEDFNSSFFLPFSIFRLEKHLNEYNIINLHWVNGFVHYPTFFERINNKKIIWNLHDMSHFTGGCAHAFGCEKFISGCKNCPNLKIPNRQNYTEKMLKIKQKGLKHIKDNNLVIVCPSNWLTNLSKKSLLFKRFEHYTIPNPFDDSIFKILNKEFSQNFFGIPKNKKSVLFFSTSIDNKNKGFLYLKKALEILNDSKIQIITIGDFVEIINETKTINLGYINDERLIALALNAADVMVSPSLAETWGNTISESLLCGVPVVAFNNTAIPEQLQNYQNGLLVETNNEKKLAEAIHEVLYRRHLFSTAEEIRTEAQKKCSYSVVEERYHNLFHSL